jgi:cation diffusion facilitator family transporter
MEYISSFIEGILISSMGFFLFYISIKRFLTPFELRKLETGIIISGMGGIINFITGIYLYQKGKKLGSIAIKTDAKHLFSDTITTTSVLFALLIIAITNKKIIDPLLSLFLSIYIISLGTKSIIETADEILDRRIDEEDIIQIKKILDSYSSSFIEFHELRTRKSGRKKFIDLHIVFLKDKKISEVHKICDEIEDKIKEKIKDIDIIIHPEPYEND